ncbi:MAG: hypothetical protein JRD93_10105 [Deltaproteobacteria bacterium]|nr:hypothetical protein [Deltaproteobacteria bacterium]
MDSTTLPRRKKKHRHLKAPSVPKETIPVRFREFIFPKQRDPNPESSFIFHKKDQSLDNIRIISKPKDQQWLLDLSKDERIPSSIKNTQLTEENLETPEKRWVYVFENKGNKAFLLFEVRPTEEDSAECVDWGPRNGIGGHRRWRKKKNRPVSYVKQELLLDKGKKYFACISQHQIPFERIKELEKNYEIISKRATAFETQDGNFASLINNHGKEMLTVYLVDSIRYAQYMQFLYILAHEKYLEYSADPAKATLANIAQVSWRIANYLDSKRKDAWKWIDRDALENNLRKIKEVRDKLENERGNACLRRNAWYKTEIFNECLNDYDYGEGLIARLLDLQAKFINCSLESEEGQIYLDYAFDNHEWFKRWVKNPWDLSRRIAKLSGKFYEKGIDSNLEILKQWAFKTIKALDLAQAEKEVILIIKRFDVVEEVSWRDARGQFGKINLKKAGVSSLGEYYEAKRLGIDREAGAIREELEIKRKGERAKLKIANFMLALAVINLMFACKAFYKKRKKGNDKLGEMRAFVSLTKATASCISAIDKTPIAKVLERRVGNRVLKPMYRAASILSAIADYIGGLIDIYRGQEEGRGALVLSGTLTAFAGVAGVAGFIAGITKATVLCLSSFAWSIIGIVLLIGTVIVIWVFYEEPLEKWLRNTPWGKSTTVDWITFGRTRPNLSELHQNLYKIMSRFYLEKLSISGTTFDSQFIGKDQYRLIGPYDMYIRFGYLPPTAVVDVKLHGVIKAHKDDKTYKQFTHIQIMPYLNTYTIISSKDLYFDGDRGLPFWVGFSKSKGKECQALFMNLIDEHLHLKHEELRRYIKDSKIPLQQWDNVSEIDWRYDVQIDLFGDKSVKIPSKNFVVVKRIPSSSYYKSDSYDLDS